MNKLLYLFIFIVSFQLSAQVGIGTNTPDNSAILDMQSNNKGILFPRLTSVQRLSINAPSSGLYVYDTNTKSLWYYNGTLWINTVSEASFGDIKSGIQTADHSGWILLDGRALSTLNANQQAVATTLGLSANLPNANSAFLVQNGTSIGSVSGSNTTTLTQANLPNVNFIGTAATAGSHAHTVDPAATNSSSQGSHDHTTPLQVISTSTYTHNHGVGNGSNAYNDVPQNVPGLMRRTFPGEALTTNGLDNIFSGEEADLRFSPKAIPNDAHSHSAVVPSVTTSLVGSHVHSVDLPSTTSSTDGNHTHTVSVASGGTATAINIAPKSLSVNMFIYLGL